MAYSPENNPYVPGDPYSYDLKWMVEEIKSWKDPADSAERAKASEEAAAASARAAAGSAAASANNASASAGSAAQAKNYADNIADPVSGIVTGWLADNITQPTTPIVDASLTIAGAAADAKATGDIVLFKYPYPLTFTDDVVYSIVANDFFAAGGGCYAVIDATNIKSLEVVYARYIYPAVPPVMYFSGPPSAATRIGYEYQTTASGLQNMTNYTCTIPAGTTHILIQGYSTVAYPQIKTNGILQKYVDDVDNKISELLNATNRKLSYSATSNSIQVTSMNTNGDPVVFNFGKRGPNNIPDITGISVNGTTLFGGGTDSSVMPYQVKAIMDINGDDPNNITFTGGNHNYNNNGGLDGSPTGRCASLKFYADDVELAAGDTGYCHLIKIIFSDYIQAYNTRKIDGTGREVLREDKIYTWDGEKLSCCTELMALEAIEILSCYGYGMGVDRWPTVVYIGGANNTPFNYLTHLSSGNIKPSAIKAYSNTDVMILEIDRSYALGMDPALDNNTSGMFCTGSKVYAYLIKNTSYPAGAVLASRASYTFRPAI